MDEEEKPPSDEGGARRAEGEKITLQYCAEIYRTAFLIVRTHATLSLPLERKVSRSDG